MWRRVLLTALIVSWLAALWIIIRDRPWVVDAPDKAAGRGVEVSPDSASNVAIPAPLRASGGATPLNRETIVITIPHDTAALGSVEPGRTESYIAEYILDRTEPAKAPGRRIEAEVRAFQSVRDDARRRGNDMIAVEAVLAELQPLVADLHEKRTGLDLEMAELCRARLAQGTFSESEKVEHPNERGTAYMTFPSDRRGYYRTFSFTRNDAPRVFAALDTVKAASSQMDARLAETSRFLATQVAPTKR